MVQHECLSTKASHLGAFPFLPNAGSQALPGSVWEPTAVEALPREAEPLVQCVPRQSLGTRCAETGMHPSHFSFNPLPRFGKSDSNHKSIGLRASVANGKATFLPAPAEEYAAIMISRTALPSSPVTEGC